MGKRRRLPTPKLAGAPPDNEHLFLKGELSADELVGRLVSEERVAIHTDKKIETNGGSVVLLGRLDGTPVVLKKTTNPVVSEAVFTRLLNAALPGCAPKVLHISQNQVLMDRAQMVRPTEDKMDMLVQVLDKLQKLSERGVRFRHGDLHWGNIVRVRSPVFRHRKRGNAFVPTGAENTWYNMRCKWTYQLIDFEMSALKTDAVTYEVPNPMYSPESVFSTQHDIRILMTALYEHLWVGESEDRTLCKRYKLPHTRAEVRVCAQHNHNAWFAYFVKGVVSYARAQSTLYATTLCVDTNNALRSYLLDEDNADLVRCAINLTPEWKMLWNAFPGGWSDLVSKADGRVPFTHMQYAGMRKNTDTTIFEPATLMKLCCWYQGQSNRYWHENRSAVCPWEPKELLQQCALVCP